MAFRLSFFRFFLGQEISIVYGVKNRKKVGEKRDNLILKIFS